MSSKTVQTHIDSERGATMIEYALLLSLIALVGLAGVPSMSTAMNETFWQVRNTLDAVNTDTAGGGSGTSSGTSWCQGGVCE